jgi:hypothetical protein
MPETKAPKVYIILASWDNGVPDCEIRGAFADITTARKALKRLVKKEYKKGGVLYEYDADDEFNDWEITQEDDMFLAESDSLTHWVKMKIIEEKVR